MIKDNHTDAAGGVRPAVDRVRAYLSEQKKSMTPSLHAHDTIDCTIQCDHMYVMTV